MAKRRDKNRHTFWKRLHFKYRLTILNENTLEEVWKLKISMFGALMLYLGSFFILMIVASVIIIQTPLRNYLPGYLDSEVREEAIKVAIQVDSLETKQKYQEAYLQNIKNIFDGKIQAVSESGIDTVMISSQDASLQSSSREIKFKNRYEDEEKYNIASSVNNDLAPTEGITFFRPRQGVVVSKFNLSLRQYGIEIAATAESVVATLEGTIVYSGYDTEKAYVIQIQHKNGFVSIYKGLSMVLKKSGDKVRTGEAIGITQTGKDKNLQRKLYFELWYKGTPVNPELYMSF